MRHQAPQDARRGVRMRCDADGDIVTGATMILAMSTQRWAGLLFTGARGSVPRGRERCREQ